MNGETPSWPVWSCELKPVNEGSEFTVGALHTLSCMGEGQAAVGPNAKILVSDANNAWTLHILRVLKSEPTNAVFEVTGYKPGKFENQQFQVSDGVVTFEVQPMTWTVTSVIAEGQAPEQPYGPIGPFRLTMPWWFWGSILIFVLLLVLLVARTLRRSVQRRRLREKLLAHSTALGPYNQFNKDMRILLRTHSASALKLEANARQFAGEINDIARLYLVRSLVVPAQDWSVSDVVREIKRQNRKVFDECGPDIRRVLRELERSNSSGAKLNVEDCEQLSLMVRKMVDHVEKVRKSGGG